MSKSHSDLSLKVISLRFYLFIFRERGREGEREGERDLVCNPDKCPDGELNLGLFRLWDDAQLIEQYYPGHGTSSFQ